MEDFINNNYDAIHYEHTSDLIINNHNSEAALVWSKLIFHQLLEIIFLINSSEEGKGRARERRSMKLFRSPLAFSARNQLIPNQN